MFNPFKSIRQNKEFFVPQLDPNHLSTTFNNLRWFFHGLEDWRIDRVVQVQGQIKVTASRKVMALRAFIEDHE